MCWEIGLPTTASPLNCFKGITEHFSKSKDWIDAAPVSLDCQSTFWRTFCCEATGTESGLGDDFLLGLA